MPSTGFSPLKRMLYFLCVICTPRCNQRQEKIAFPYTVFLTIEVWGRWVFPMLWINLSADCSQTLYSAYKSCKRAKVFNNAGCMSMSACHRGQRGRKRVAWSSVIRHFSFHFISVKRFQEHASLAETWSPVIRQRLMFSFVQHWRRRWMKAAAGYNVSSNYWLWWRNLRPNESRFQFKGKGVRR